MGDTMELIKLKFNIAIRMRESYDTNPIETKIFFLAHLEYLENKYSESSRDITYLVISIYNPIGFNDALLRINNKDLLLDMLFFFEPLNVPIMNQQKVATTDASTTTTDDSRVYCKYLMVMGTRENGDVIDISLYNSDGIFVRSVVSNSKDKLSQSDLINLISQRTTAVTDTSQSSKVTYHRMVPNDGKDLCTYSKSIDDEQLLSCAKKIYLNHAEHILHTNYSMKMYFVTDDNLNDWVNSEKHEYNPTST